MNLIRILLSERSQPEIVTYSLIPNIMTFWKRKTTDMVKKTRPMVLGKNRLIKYQ